MKKLPIVLFVCLATFAFSSPVWAQNLNLSWDASPSGSVAGYKIYYSQNEDSLPFVGVGADEGDSPVDVGDTLSATISNLDDNAIYYVAVTAYDIDGNESVYSNIVTTGWEPVLNQPSDQTSGVTIPTYVEWEAAPEGYDVSYILFYGTDQQSVEEAHVLPTPPPVSPFNDYSPNLPLVTLILVLLILQTLLKHKRSENQAFKPASAIALLVLSGMLISCSGGGSGSNNVSASDGNESSVSGVVADTDTGTTDTGTTDTGTTDTGTTDTGTTDTGTIDTGTIDTGTIDTGTIDTGTIDTGTIDTGTIDTGTIDTETIDTGTIDTETIDTGTIDTGTTDTGTTDTGTTDTVTEVIDTQTGTATVNSVDLGTDNFYEITGLNTGTAYYWKIVAVDEVNTNLEYQSAIYSFTTAN